MDDFAEKLLAEEADLERKLAAVRQMKVAYGVGTVEPNRTPKPAVTGKRQPRDLAARIDKFGPYGQRIVDYADRLLPGCDDNPVPTRILVEQLEAIGLAITGENKVNSLSALLSRSSKMKGWGRAGWTRAAAEAGDEYKSVRGDARKENEPHSEVAGGSDADHNPVRTGVVITGSTQSWPSITS